jgi:hypothetical protein
MFVKITRAKGHSYAHVVESFRDGNGQPRQRKLLTLGRLDVAPATPRPWSRRSA